MTNLPTGSPPVNGRERASEPTEGEPDVGALHTEIVRLRREVERLRAEQSDHGPRLLDVEQAADFLSVSERTLRSYLSDGTIDSLKIGRRRLVPADALTEFVEVRMSDDG